MNKILMISTTLGLGLVLSNAGPVQAAFLEQADHLEQGGHVERAEDGHDYETHGQDHRSHDMSAGDQTAGGLAPLTVTPEIDAALANGGTPVIVDVLGVVCDFCAKAMNKTFGKRDEVAAVYVDLDTKTLSLVINAGMDLNDKTIEKLVTRAGYKTSSIRRGADIMKVGADASDRS